MTEQQIITLGHKLARQLGGVFAVHPRMLADFRAYRAKDAPDTSSTSPGDTND